MNPSPLLHSLITARRPTERVTAQRCRAYTARLNEWRLQNGGLPAPHPHDLQDEFIESITTLHRDAMTPWDWRQLASASPPPPEHRREAEARHALGSYAPTFFEGLLGKAEAHRRELEAAALRARAEDETIWRAVVDQWTWVQGLARGVLQGDLSAYEAAIAAIAPFEELESLGESVKVRLPEPSLAEAFVTARFDAVPLIEYHVLASGRVNFKTMPRNKRGELMQAHICSAALRVAREIFALLPATCILVHVGVVMLNPATGHTEAYTLLSVEFDRERLLASNFDRVDPASAVEAFRHAMNFKKSTGLQPVTELEPLAQITSLEPEAGRGRSR